jgi:hypothetical protein
MTSRQNLSLGFHIRADGPSPVTNSMFSILVWGFSDDQKKHIFHRRLNPIPGHEVDPLNSMAFWAKQNNDDETVPCDPKKMITELVDWIKQLKQSFDITCPWIDLDDWGFLSHYYYTFRKEFDLPELKSFINLRETRVT